MPDLAAKIRGPAHDSTDQKPEQKDPASDPQGKRARPSEEHETGERHEPQEAHADRSDESRLFVVLHEGLGVAGKVLDQLFGGLPRELDHDRDGRDQYEQCECGLRELRAPPQQCEREQQESDRESDHRDVVERQM